MNNELCKNAEGYTDPTAAATLNRPEPGDVWEYNGARCLIIKNHGRLSTILLLTDNDHPNNAEVMTKNGPLYTDTRLLTYGHHVKMGKYVETVGVEDFKRLIEAVEKAVGLRLLVNVEMVNTPPSDDAAKLLELSGQVSLLQEQLTAAREHTGTLEHLQNLKTAELTAANNAAAKARNQLELLREMYNDLLARTLGEA